MNATTPAPMPMTALEADLLRARQQVVTRLAGRAIAVTRAHVRGGRIRVQAAALVAAMHARDLWGAEAVAARIIPAELDAVAAEVWRIEAHALDPDRCHNPGCPRNRDRGKARNAAGYCRSCYERWKEAGRPAGGPPPPGHGGRLPGSRAGRLDDYRWLREEQHLDRRTAARRVGIKVRTAQRYDHDLTAVA